MKWLKYALLFAVFSTLVFSGDGVKAQDTPDWQKEILNSSEFQNDAVKEAAFFYDKDFLAESANELAARQKIMTRYLEEMDFDLPIYEGTQYKSISEVESSSELVEVEGIDLSFVQQPLLLAPDAAAITEKLIADMEAESLTTQFWVTSATRAVAQNYVLFRFGYPVPDPAVYPNLPSEFGWGFSLAVNNVDTRTGAYAKHLQGLNSDNCNKVALEIEKATIDTFVIPTVRNLIDAGCITSPDYIKGYEFLMAREDIKVLDLTWAYSLGYLPSGKPYLLSTDIKPVLSVYVLPS